MSITKTEAALNRLVNIATTLYKTGRWRATGVQPERAAQLWAMLRNECDINPGQSQPARAGESEIDEALNLVYGDRQGDYGTPRDNYAGIAQVWSGLLHMVLKRPITPAEAALMMVGVKLQRQAMKHKRDNLVDAHGYLVVYSRIIEEEAK